MKNNKPIALISVSDKTGLVELARVLEKNGYRILSTGGTARVLTGAGIEVTPLSDYTSSPEILDGRVKSLHPRIFAGLLALRKNPEHLVCLKEMDIEPIDLLAVNLYPFAARKKELANDDPSLLDHIDIGGVSLLRAGAKNYRSVTVLSDPSQYPIAIEAINNKGNEIPLDLRRRLAHAAFRLTAAYDREIADIFSSPSAPGEDLPGELSFSSPRLLPLRYGENPHQRGAFYRDPSDIPGSLVSADRLQGKELSYNNILDLESALSLAAELGDPAAVIVKHNNPCGAGRRSGLLESYRRARATDPMSAFGSIIAFTGKVGVELAREVTATFVEAVVAPAFTTAAREVFKKKKNLRLLRLPDLLHRRPGFALRSVSGGLLLQDTDRIIWDEKKMETVAGPSPDEKLWADLKFAWIVCKHTRSNAIVLGGRTATVGVGAGQMSRIDAARLAVTKARQAGLDISGTVMASDAFFPFRDVVDFAAEVGVTAVVQPGGSIRDKESIAAAREHGVTMVMTGVRHFRH